MNRHVHEFIRVRGKKDRYKCADPDCFWTGHKFTVKGKRSLCSVCHVEEIIMDAANMLLAGPRCINCSKSKKAKLKVGIMDMLEGLDL